LRWSRGEAEVEALVAGREVQRVAAADGAAWLDKARRTVDTAGAVGDGDPESAFVLAYDAARQACTGLLAHQGLRPTSAGGHYAVERAVRAQFGDAFKPFAALRRRRNELEYPAFPGECVEATEVTAAVAIAEGLIDAVERLLPEVGPF
jgi:hypothetical protein